jgi:misacylated tRNA(Ala) deacylase
MIYQDDSYQKEFETEVVEVNSGKYVILNDTAFYPNAGGQPNDTGMIIKNSEEYKVVYVGKFDGKISHEVEKEGLKVGDKIKGKIDWEKRYKLMRYHTAAHVFTKVIFNETGALISGNQLGVDVSRIDFSLEKFDKELVQKWIDETNKVIEQKIPVKIELIPREEALKIENFVRTMADLLQKIDVLRVVNIEGFDKQACGGTHIKNLGEIIGIELVKTENKGKNNRRIYFRLKESI